MHTPSQDILEKYANVLVNYALNHTKGIRKGDVVLLEFETIATPLALEIHKKILEKGAHAIIRPHYYRFSRQLLEIGNDNQLKFFPKEYKKSLIDTIDHRLYILADEDPFYLKDIDPQKFTIGQENKILLRKWMEDKEDKGKFSWTLALYATPAMAKEAGLSLRDFWKQIINACFLNEKDPIDKWRETTKEIQRIEKKLTKMKIDKIHLEAENTDLFITIGERRKWISGRGANIPSFEIFTSPDWRGTNGKIYFDYPLYRFGNLIKDIYLEFENGKVIKAKAKKGQKILDAMIQQKNADKIGEYSLTDRRFSKITKFMANTLYDENFGGQYGNTHLALGTSYNEAYDGKQSSLDTKKLRSLGFNKSPEHTDIIATSKRIVTAIWNNGTKKIIYKDGVFTI